MTMAKRRAAAMVNAATQPCARTVEHCLPITSRQEFKWHSSWLWRGRHSRSTSRCS